MRQKQFFESQKTKDIAFRIAQLKRLRDILRLNENEIFKAIEHDFGKSEFETFSTELLLVYNELNLAIKNVKRWARVKRVSAGLFNFPSRTYICPEPLGAALVIGAANYPFQLSLSPVVSSIAAGNVTILKPSEITPHSSRCIARLINENFEKRFLCVIEGGAHTTQQLLDLRFDKIFFTGSERVGKIVALAAAKNLTPVTLELGGKSPCFVFADADLKMSAQRIVWGKFLNAGQTCIAPDYLLVEKKIYEEFVELLKQQIPRAVGTNPEESASYTKILSGAYLLRLKNLIDGIAHSKKLKGAILEGRIGAGTSIVAGGNVDAEKRYMSPTLVRDCTFHDELMSEEIFGPILPVIAFDDEEAAMSEVLKLSKPLALYVFTSNKNLAQKILRRIPFGGGCVNDVLMHVSCANLPFGGVGSSGMGSYHGEFGFRAFTHQKSVLKRRFWFEPTLKHPPYARWKLRLLKVFSR